MKCLRLMSLHNAWHLIRVRLKATLVRVGYNPVDGFPGDAELGIPPAAPGSLKDLGSDRRLNLILDTQARLIAGKGQQQRGLDATALDQFPAYELVRGGRVKTPREWLKRWKTAADNIDWQGVSKAAFAQGRMIALKTSLVWGAIGSSALFNDALDVDHPPFAFNSQMVWEVRDREDCDEFGLDPNAQRASKVLDEKKLPPSVASAQGLDQDFVTALASKRDQIEARDGRLTLQGVFGVAAPPPSRSRTNALLACVDALDVRFNARKKIKGGKYMTHPQLPSKRCGGAWIPGWKDCHQGLPAQGKQGAAKIGQEGTAESLKLPDLRAMPALPRTPRATVEAAMQEIQKGVIRTDPRHLKVHFSAALESHLKFNVAKGDLHRAAFLPQAKETVTQPHEIWEYRHRHRYIASFERSDGSKAFGVVTSRHTEHENLAVTFQPIDWKHIKKWRVGKLLYTAY